MCNNCIFHSISLQVHTPSTPCYLSPKTLQNVVGGSPGPPLNVRNSLSMVYWLLRVIPLGSRTIIAVVLICLGMSRQLWQVLVLARSNKLPLGFGKNFTKKFQKFAFSNFYWYGGFQGCWFLICYYFEVAQTQVLVIQLSSVIFWPFSSQILRSTPVQHLDSQSQKLKAARFGKS